MADEHVDTTDFEAGSGKEVGGNVLGLFEENEELAVQEIGGPPTPPEGAISGPALDTLYVKTMLLHAP